MSKSLGAQPDLSAVYPADTTDPSPVIRQLTHYDERARGAAGQDEAPDAAGAVPQQIPATPAATPPPFDALLLADGGPRLQTVLGLLGYFDIDPKTTRLLGSMRWLDDPALQGNPTLQGAWIAAPNQQGVDEFNRQFQSVFGRQPSPLAGLAYDATALAALLAKTDHRFDPAVLTAPEGFAGRLGIFRLRQDGLVDHGLAIVEFGAPPGRVLDPAPSTFAAGLASR
jgi:hypothetical protein